MDKLFLHRVEPINRDGKIIFEEIAERPEYGNCGVIYSLGL